MMKHFFVQLKSILFVLAVAMLVTGCSGISSKKLDGTGTQADPYVISNEAQLMTLLNSITKGNSYSGEYVILGNDIDMGKVKEFSSKTEGSFDGSFDGRGYTISNLNYTSKDSGSLIYRLRGTVCNLSLRDGEVTGDEESASIATFVEDTGRIINCINTVEVYGEEAGGIAYSNNGLIVNCCNLLGKKSEAAQKLVKVNEAGIIENCYTGHAGLYELINSGNNPEMTERVLSYAVSNLNSRLFDLGIENKDIQLCYWQAGEKFPELKKDYYNAVCSAKVIDNAGTESILEYDSKRYGFCVNGNADSTSFSEARFFDANENELFTVKLDDAAKEQHIDYNGVDCPLYFWKQDTVIVDSEEKNASVIDLSGEVICSDDAIGVDVSYCDINGNILRQEKKIYLLHAGSYELTGQLTGQVIANLKTSDCKLKLLLKGVNIASDKGPGILVLGDGKKSKLNIQLSDENYVAGIDWIDTHAKEHKCEGAISSELPMKINGEAGQLTVASRMEGIEADKLSITGGTYIIESADDGISSKECKVNNSRIIFDAGDDAFDTDELNLNDTTIIGKAPFEHAINGTVCMNNGLFAMIGKGKSGADYSSESTQSSIEFNWKSGFEKDKVFLLTREDGTPVIAIKATANAYRVTLSTPELVNGKYKLYSVDSIAGVWDEMVCTQITDYAIRDEYTSEGKDIFEINSVANVYEMDEE